FLREARLAAALNHPNICTIHAVGEVQPGEERSLPSGEELTPGTPFIAMELIEGASLAKRLRDEGALALDELLEIARQVTAGLAAAHAREIVHRDLKPGNVMLTKDGRAKILDFGLAKPLTRAAKDGVAESEADTISEELTREGLVMGTSAYMSPEQVRGDPLDTRSDVFSFGIMLYEMVAGHRPFHGETASTIRLRIVEAEPDPLPAFCRNLPPELEQIIWRCLEKKAEERYNDTRDLVVAIEGLRNSTATGKRVRPVSRAAPRRRLVLWSAVAVACAVAAIGYLRMRPVTETGNAMPDRKAVAPGAATGRKIIVVLPFENLGPAEDAYFAAGITEEITRRLSMVNGLGVISRKSAVQYARLEKTVREIGAELHAGYILEGTVLWAHQPDGTSRVRITPQLIRVADDTHLWANAYERQIRDIFGVQSEIAGEVIRNLGLTLRDREAALIREEPTRNPEAYQAYLRGELYFASPDHTKADVDMEVEMFRRAVELDPNFALAYAGLAKSHGLAAHLAYGTSEERLSLAKAAAERALELAPHSPRVRLATGYYHYLALKDYGRALEDFAIAEEGLPGDGDVLQAQGLVFRRQGLFEASRVALEKALELSPRDAELASDLAGTYAHMRKYAEAVQAYDRSIALAPDQVNAYEWKARTYYLWKGTTAEARATLEAIPDKKAARSAWFDQEVAEGKYREALDRVSSWSAGWSRGWRQGVMHRLLGEPEAAREAFEEARRAAIEQVRTHPEEPFCHMRLGLALAWLGFKDEATREGERAIEMVPLSSDHLRGTVLLRDLGLVYILVGEHEKALDHLELLLSIPSEVSIPYLRLMPWWAPLRDHPRFKDLEKRFGQSLDLAAKGKSARG
ncbi:MAG TPA: protein kinase, partial [Candidatus Saccharimonadales bacterium]|nr:protein kinase [Candidatus Saccharimonadales bacterium]